MRRWDAAQILPKATRADEGYLIAPATRCARTGVQEYRREDGSVQRELRLPEDVFSAESLSSLTGKPIVHKHPGRVDAKNARQHMRGVATSARQDGDFLVADLVIHDAGLIEAAERGDSEVSLGYDTILVPIPGGVFKQDGHPLDGTRADFRQTRIVHNHVALLPRGRANEGTRDRPVKLRLDGAGNQLEEQTLVKINVAGVEVDVPEESAKTIEGAFASSKKAIEQAEARADAAEQKLKSIEEKKDDAAEQAKKAEQERTRFDLLNEAKPILKLDSAELLKLSNTEIKRRVLGVWAKDLKLDGKSDDYVDASFDLHRPKVNTAAKLAQVITGMEQRADAADKNESPYAKAIREREEKRAKGAK